MAARLLPRPLQLRPIHVPAQRYVTEAASERNWLHRAEVQIATSSGAVTYQVFFAVKKARRADRHDVEMTVGVGIRP